MLKKTFPNGATCLAIKASNKAPINISVYFPGGRLFETETNSGITYLLLQFMLNKSRSLNKNSNLADQVTIENHADFCGFSLNVAKEDFMEGLRSLFLLLTLPIKETAYLTKEKDKSLLEIQKTNQDPLRRPVELFYQSLFAGHPYAFSRYGTESIIESISFDQILDWKDEVVRMDQLFIVISGSVAPEQALDEVFEIFGMFTTEKRPSRALVLPLMPSKKFLPKIEQSRSDRTSVVLGHKGVDSKDHRYDDLEVLRNWLAGSKGKLHLSLREKLSLAQNVNAYNVSLLRGGAFFLHAISKPEDENKLVEYMTAFFSSLNKVSISKEEFDNAKKQAITLYLQGLQSNDALSYHMANQLIAGKDPTKYEDYETRITKVQHTKMMSVLKEIFSEELYAVGIVRGTHG
jgi:zinc protease